MNDLIPFGNGDTARMNTWQIYELLNRNLPENRKGVIQHNAIVKKTKQLITAGVIKSQQIIDIKVNQGLRGHKTVKGFEFVGEEGERSSIIVIAQMLPEVVGYLWDSWRELRRRYQELEQKLLVLISNEALAEEAENLKAQMLDGTIDPEDAENQVAKWFRNRKGTGSKAGKALVGQRKLKCMERELNTIAISYVQPQLPLN